MSSSLEIAPFSKKLNFIRLKKTDQRERWEKSLHDIGARWNDNTNDPGWIIPTNNMENFDDVVHTMGSRKKSKCAYGNVSKQSSSMKDISNQVRDLLKSSEQKSEKNNDNKCPRRHSRLRHVEQEHQQEDNADGNEYDSDTFVPRSRQSDTEKAEQSEQSEDDSEYQDESSDDELIQTVLARRILSESEQKSIDVEEVGSSDREDIISCCRRLRHLYTVLKTQRNQIEQLEKRLENKASP